MRVVAGKYRGKKLKEFELTSTRPTLDKVKEAMYDIVQFKVSGARVLDLFAGTGALGIEAISRGADSVDFVDNNADAIKLINFNLKGIEGDYTVNQLDCFDFLKRNKKHYDIILLDPPFATDLCEQSIEYILKHNVLESFGIILAETQYNKQIELKFLPTAKQKEVKELTLKNKVEIEANGKRFEISKRKYGTVGVYVIEQV